jgi:hypothetical protein
MCIALLFKTTSLDTVGIFLLFSLLPKKLQRSKVLNSSGTGAWVEKHVFQKKKKKNCQRKKNLFYESTKHLDTWPLRENCQHQFGTCATMWKCQIKLWSETPFNVRQIGVIGKLNIL